MTAYNVQARNFLSTGQPAIAVLSSRPRCSARQRSQVQVHAFKTVERGASGLDVNGMRPTSPAAWQIMRAQLRERKVCTLESDCAAKSICAA